MSNPDYAILGSVTVRPAPGAAALALSEQNKLLLARLLLEPGERVSTDALIDALWGGKLGRHPRNAVQVAVSAVRGLLGDTGRQQRVILTDGDGYRLVVGDALRIDAERFRRLAARGHDLVARHPRAALAMLTEALATWRGPLFGELGEREWAIGHARALASVRDRAPRSIATRSCSRSASTPSSSAPCACRSCATRSTNGGAASSCVLCTPAVAPPRRSWPTARSTASSVRSVPTCGRSARRSRAAGRSPRRPTARPDPPAEPAVGAGADGLLLCAILDSRPGASGRPGLGMLTLLVDRAGGEPHLLSADVLVATFADPEATLSAAAAIAAEGSPAARVGVHAGGIVRLGDGLRGSGAGALPAARLGGPPGPGARDRARARVLAGAGIELRDLGEQRFFDLGPGEVVFELPTRPDGERFPPPATLSRVPNNLPVQTTRFLGREQELASLSRMVGGGELVTLTGAGGCGKTRLALQLVAGLAPSFADGVWFAELAEVAAGADAEAVATTIARQLGVRALPGETQSAALVRHLSDRVALLVLDNCEQVHASCGEVAAALRDGCRGVCVVATTRRPLRIHGEQTFTVASMGVDDDGRGLPVAAVQLLLERGGLLSERGVRRRRSSSRRASAARSTGCRWRSSSPPPRSRRAGCTPSPRASRR